MLGKGRLASAERCEYMPTERSLTADRCCSAYILCIAAAVNDVHMSLSSETHTCRVADIGMWAADKSRVTAWGWDAPGEAFEQDFSFLSTDESPAAPCHSQAAQPSLILCRASGLIWRLNIAAPQQAGFKHWEAQVSFATATL